MKISIALFITIFSLASAAAESHGAHSDGAAHHVAGIESLIPFWVNFGILFVVLFFLLKNKIIVAWGHRRMSIAQNVSSATAELKESKTLLSLSVDKLSRIDVECRLAKESIAKQAESEASLKLQTAKDKAERVVKQAEENAQADMRKAEDSLKKELVDKALHQARETLGRDSSVKFGSAMSQIVANQSGQLIH